MIKDLRHSVSRQATIRTPGPVDVVLFFRCCMTTDHAESRQTILGNKGIACDCFVQRRDRYDPTISTANVCKYGAMMPQELP